MSLGGGVLPLGWYIEYDRLIKMDKLAFLYQFEEFKDYGWLFLWSTQRKYK